MTTLAKTGDVDEVKTEVKKIAGHVDKKITQNLEQSINEAASKVAADNRNLI